MWVLGVEFCAACNRETTHVDGKCDRCAFDAMVKDARHALELAVALNRIETRLDEIEQTLNDLRGKVAPKA